MRFSTGDSVRVRDNEKEEWKNGTVTDMRGDKPVVKLQGQSRGFTWTFVEHSDGSTAKTEPPPTFESGDVVRVRDNGGEDWKEGIVTDVRLGKPVVKLQGQARAFSWNFFELIKKGSSSKSGSNNISVGDKLRVRDNAKEDWKTGTVTDMRGDKPVVKLEGQSRGFTWTFFEPASSSGGGGGGGSAAGTKSSSGSKPDIGDKVRVRDNEREDWKVGTVTEMRGDKPVVQLPGQSRSFTWTFCELEGGGGGGGDSKPPTSSGGGNKISIGDTIRVRDNEKESWKNGTVTDMRGDKPVVKLDGQSRGFTWTFFEPASSGGGGGKSSSEKTSSSKIDIGDKVRVRDNEKEDWKVGTVTEMRGDKPVVQLSGQSRAFTWTFFELEGGSSSVKPSSSPSSKISIGGKVRVRDNEKEDWKTGTVTDMRGDKPVVKLDGQSRGFTWTFFEPASSSGGGGGKSSSEKTSSSKIDIGDKVRVRDNEKEDWKVGTVTDMRGDKPVVQLAGQSRGFTWTFFEKEGSDSDAKPTSSSTRISIGDKIQVRDNEKEDWKTGTVTDMRGDKPVVKLEGQSRAFTWTFFEPVGGGEQKPTPPSSGDKISIGDKVRVRDNEKEDWKNGTVSDMRGNKAVVKLDGQSRGFTWTFCESLSGGSDVKPSPPSSGKISIGDKVRVRDNEKEDWKTGTVTDMRGDKPVVKLEGQSRGFTWTFFEPTGGSGGGGGSSGGKTSSSKKIDIGDKVRVRDNEKEDWKVGTVTDMRGDKPVVQLSGQSRAFTWTFFELEGGGGGGSDSKPSGSSGKISIGDKVRVRDNDKEDWKTGTVTDMRGDKPVVKLDGQSRGFTWTFFEPASSSGGGGGKSSSEKTSSSKIDIGDKVRVRDNEKEDWKVGTVTEMRGDKPVVQLSGQSRAFTWTFFELEGGGGGGGSDSKPSGSSGKISIGDKVQVRDNEKEDWKNGTVTDMRGDKPVVKLDGQSRGFTWTFFEPVGGGKGGSSSKPSSGGKIDIGDKVRVRDNEKEDWKVGTVTDMRGDKPVVQLSGQSRAFTWTFFELEGGGGGGGGDVKPTSSSGKISIGDKLRVRDNEKEDWKTGTVTDMRGDKPVVKLDGQSRGFTWSFFEPTGGGSEIKPSPPSSGKISIGDKVRVRDNDKEDWKNGTVTDMRGDKAVVKLDGQSRGFTWTFCESLSGGSDVKPSPPSSGKISIGDKVQVRDNEKEDWKNGTVTDMRGDKAVVKLDGQSRGFTWTFCEPVGGGRSGGRSKPSSGKQIDIGDKVRVRDNEKEDWKVGTVTEMRGDKPVVQLSGQSRAFTWTFFELEGGGGGGGSDSKPSGSSGKISIGDKVQVRDNEKEDWKTGTVTDMRGDKPVVKLEGQSRAFTWTFFEPVGGGEQKPTPPSSGDKISIGDKVRVRDNEKEDWKNGTVSDMRGNKAVVKLDGQSRGFTWTFCESLSGGSDVKPSPPSSGKISIGDKVRVRDNEKEDWKTGTVSDMRGDKAVVKLDGQSRGFTWTFCEIASGRSSSPVQKPPSRGEVAVGDKVRVRDNEKEDWKNGTVTDMRGDKPVVKLDGQSRGFTWTIFEVVGSSSPKPTPPAGGKVSTGDKVRVRDNEKEEWKTGTVSDMRGDKPVVKLDGQSRGFTWTFFEVVGSGSNDVDKKPSPPSTSKFSIGDLVSVKDAEKEDWKNGTVSDMRGNTPIIKLEGQSRGFSWRFCEPRGDKSDKSEGTQFVVGDTVRVRDSEKEDWKPATVREISGGKTYATLEGQSRSHTWSHMEIDKTGGATSTQPAKSSNFRVDDTVRVRDSEKEEWKYATVTEIQANGTPLARVEGANRSYSWDMMELDKTGGGGGGGGKTTTQASNFRVGDAVLVRQSEKESWQSATVSEISGSQVFAKSEHSNRSITWNHISIDKTGGKKKKDSNFRTGDIVRVRDSSNEGWKTATVREVTSTGDVLASVDGNNRSYTWNQMEIDKTAGSGDKTQSSSLTTFRVGDCVRVRDSETEDWRSATVAELRGGNQTPIVVLEGQTRGYSWNYCEIDKTSVDDRYKKVSPPGKGAIPDSRLDDYTKGAMVRALRTIHFKSGRVIQTGDVGFVTKVPGDSVGSPAQVRFADITYSIDHGEVEVVGGNTVMPPPPPVQQQPTIVHPPYISSPVMQPTYQQAFPSPPMMPMHLPPAQTHRFSPPHHPAKPPMYFHDTTKRAPEPSLPPPQFVPNPIPPPQPFQMHLTNESLNWQLLSGIDTTKLLHAGHTIDVEILESIMKNVTYATLPFEEAAQLQPRHVQHLFSLSQLVTQYLVYTQKYVVNEKDAMSKQAEEQYHESCSLRELYDKLTFDYKELASANKHLKKTVYMYELGVGHNGKVNGGGGGGGGEGSFKCDICGRLFKKENHLLSHSRKRHNGAAGVTTVNNNTAGDNRLYDLYQQLLRKNEADSEQRNREAAENTRFISQLTEELKDLKKGASPTLLSEPHRIREAEVIKREQELEAREREHREHIATEIERKRLHELRQSEGTKKIMEEEIIKLKGMLSQKPQAWGTDEEEDETIVITPELRRGDGVRIVQAVRIEDEYAGVGETGVVMRVPGDHGMAAVISVGGMTCNAPQRYFKKITEAYTPGDHVCFNKLIRLRSGRIIEAGSIGEVRRVPGDNGAVAEVQIDDILYDAHLSEIRKYEGRMRQKPQKPTLASVAAPHPAPIPRSSRQEVVNSQVVTSPSAASQRVVIEQPVVEQEIPVSPLDILMSFSDNVPELFKKFTGKFSCSTSQVHNKKPVWKHTSSDVWVFNDANNHWVVTDESVFSSGRGWFFSKTADHAPYSVAMWQIAGTPPIDEIGIRTEPWKPKYLSVEVTSLQQACGFYELQGNLLNGHSYYQLTTRQQKAVSSPYYLYSSTSGHWVITDSKNDFTSGQGYLYSTTAHGNSDPTKLLNWTVGGVEQKIIINEARESDRGDLTQSSDVEVKSAETTEKKFKLGQMVEVRDASHQDWKQGKIVAFADDNKPQVLATGHQSAYVWNHIQHAPSLSSDSKTTEKESSFEAEYPDVVRITSKDGSLSQVCGKYKKVDGTNDSSPSSTLQMLYAHVYSEKWLFISKNKTWCISNRKDDMTTGYGYVHSIPMTTQLRGPTQVDNWFRARDESVDLHCLSSALTLPVSFWGLKNDVKEQVTLRINKSNHIEWCQNLGEKSETTQIVEELILDNGILKDPSSGWNRRIRIGDPSEDLLRDIADLGMSVKIPIHGFPQLEGTSLTMEPVNKDDKVSIQKARFQVRDEIDVRDTESRPWQVAIITSISNGVIMCKPRNYSDSHKFRWMKRSSNSIKPLPHKWMAKASQSGSSSPTAAAAAPAAAPAPAQPKKATAAPPAKTAAQPVVQKAVAPAAAPAAVAKTTSSPAARAPAPASAPSPAIVASPVKAVKEKPAESERKSRDHKVKEKKDEKEKKKAAPAAASKQPEAKKPEAKKTAAAAAATPTAMFARPAAKKAGGKVAGKPKGPATTTTTTTTTTSTSSTSSTTDSSDSGSSSGSSDTSSTDSSESDWSSSTR